MNDPEVVALITKKVGQANHQGHAALVRQHKAVVRAVKEAVGTAGLDKKVARALSDHVLAAMAPHAPPAQVAAE